MQLRLTTSDSCEQGVERDLFEAGRSFHVRGNLHDVGAQEPHSEGGGSPRHGAAAVADADDAQRLLGKGSQLRLAPVAVMHVRVHTIELSGQHQHVAENGVGHRLAERVRRVAHDDAAPFGFGHVDRVDAGAPFRDHAQVGGRAEDTRRQAIVAADDAVDTRQQREQLLLVEPFGARTPPRPRNRPPRGRAGSARCTASRTAPIPGLSSRSSCRYPP